MKTRLARVAVALMVGASGTVATSVVVPQAAMAQPCGYYAKGTRGYIYNCASYAQYGEVGLYSGRKICHWLNPGTEADFAEDGNVSWGALVGGPSNDPKYCP